MIQFTRYYGQFQDFRGTLGGLPGWARMIVGVFALPGLILMGLSILAFVVSLSALLLLTLPVYSLLRSLTGGSRARPEAPLSPGAKRVEVTILNDRPV